MRLIDADALKRRAQKVATESWKMNIKAKVETVLNQFIDWIDEAPTIEPSARPEVLTHGVVKCRECKHSAMIYHTNIVPAVGGFEVEGIDHIFCQCDKLGGIEMRWDDFCSKAERREDGEQ